MGGTQTHGARDPGRSHLPALGDASLHFWITHSVARANGLRFSEAMTQGVLTVQDYGALVTRCRACPHAEACLGLLNAPGGLDGIPEFCPNGETLARLAAVA